VSKKDGNILATSLTKKQQRNAIESPALADLQHKNTDCRIRNILFVSGYLQMTAKILDFARPVNGVIIEQRKSDGFINATAMCIAHGKEIKQLFRNEDSIEYADEYYYYDMLNEYDHETNVTSEALLTH
jgi:hypothetical protein